MDGILSLCTSHSVVSVAVERGDRGDEVVSIQRMESDVWNYAVPYDVGSFTFDVD
jgi:hypothetical protein